MASVEKFFVKYRLEPVADGRAVKVRKETRNMDNGEVVQNSEWFEPTTNHPSQTGPKVEGVPASEV